MTEMDLTKIMMMIQILEVMMKDKANNKNNKEVHNSLLKNQNLVVKRIKSM